MTAVHDLFRVEIDENGKRRYTIEINSDGSE